MLGNCSRRIDPNGQTWEYRYDADQRLTEAKRFTTAPAAGDNQTPDIHAQYAYDALGRRIWKQVDRQGEVSELTLFTWDGDLLQSEERYRGTLNKQPMNGEPLALIPEDPDKRFPLPCAQRQQTISSHTCHPERRVVYLYEPDSFVPAAKLESTFEAVEQATGTDHWHTQQRIATKPTLYYFQNDHLGTPQEVTDEQGTIVWLGHYRAWGELVKAQNGNGQAAQTDNPFRFQGQYLDAETGLHYNRFRYYDPKVGRFTTQDPIGLLGGENLYQYAPNPTGWVDPLGLSKCGCEGIVSSFEPKIERQMGKRGWDRTDVEDTINNPSRTVETRDTRWTSDGTRRDEPATAYIREDGHYVVRNDNDGTIVQISNRNKSDWKTPF